MIFIHDLKDWSEKQLYNVIYLNTKSLFDLLFSVSKKKKKKIKNKKFLFFIIKVDVPNQHKLISFILKSI